LDVRFLDVDEARGGSVPHYRLLDRWRAAAAALKYSNAAAWTARQRYSLVDRGAVAAVMPTSVASSCDATRRRTALQWQASRSISFSDTVRSDIIGVAGADFDEETSRARSMFRSLTR
jgi:hypothetical protein